MKPNRRSSLASMEMRTVRGFGFLLSGKRRDKEGKRGATGIWMFCLLIKKILFRTLVSFFLSFKIHIPNSYFIFFEH